MAEFRDGTGTGNKGKIDKTNRIWTRSVSRSEIEDATNQGHGFNIHTNLIEFTLAAQTDSAILYFQNNEPEEFVISNFIITNNSTATLGDSVYCKFLRNPKGGTIVTDAVVCPSAVNSNGNRDTNSNVGIGTSVAYAGGEGKTLTDSQFFGAIYCPNNQSRAAALNVAVGRGGSFGFTVDTDVTAGTLKMYAVIIGYYRDNV